MEGIAHEVLTCRLIRIGAVSRFAPSRVSRAPMRRTAFRRAVWRDGPDGWLPTTPAWGVPHGGGAGADSGPHGVRTACSTALRLRGRAARHGALARTQPVRSGLAARPGHRQVGQEAPARDAVPGFRRPGTPRCTRGRVRTPATRWPLGSGSRSPARSGSRCPATRRRRHRLRTETRSSGWRPRRRAGSAAARGRTGPGSASGSRSCRRASSR